MYNLSYVTTARTIDAPRRSFELGDVSLFMLNTSAVLCLFFWLLDQLVKPEEVWHLKNRPVSIIAEFV